ncbi:hypothetical protein GWO13_04930 [Candidatus Bathyarchaeota archaeon]|nr:hypothetical protein [Candidatus Bathyarchaeota archaeon]
MATVALTKTQFNNFMKWLSGQDKFRIAGGSAHENDTMINYQGFQSNYEPDDELRNDNLTQWIDSNMKSGYTIVDVDTSVDVYTRPILGRYKNNNDTFPFDSTAFQGDAASTQAIRSVVVPDFYARRLDATILEEALNRASNDVQLPPKLTAFLTNITPVYADWKEFSDPWYYPTVQRKANGRKNK